MNNNSSTVLYYYVAYIKRPHKGKRNKVYLASQRLRPATMAASINLAQMSDKRTSDTIEWDALLVKTAKEQFGRRARIASSFQSFATRQDKQTFLARLLRDARNINPREPVEISKNLVDVNEKIYCNSDGSEDETTVKIVNCVENSEGHNYQSTVTKGVNWGVNANVGLQFGLPQVGAGAGGSVGTSFGTQYVRTMTTENKKENRVEIQSHHEETIKIPPGKKVVVKMSSYRVRYRLDYTMEYQIPKSTYIRVLVDSCGFGMPIFCMSTRILTASQLMNSLPGYREDEEFAYFTQDGELRWIADRMEVKKTIVDMY